jgi:DNA primase small subunit
MEERTQAYLRGRFRDHYRTQQVTLPPAADRREWGHIPWTAGSETTMVRHRSLLDLGSIDGFLERKRPRHVYFSAGRYDDPGAGSMAAKGWQSADLVFDLDADHLPSVDPTTTSYREMLDACKDALFRLLDFLENDFGFEDLTIVFSGGRGYHVHVRDESVLALDREHRREIVEYVRGHEVSFDRLVTTETVAGAIGRSSPADKRTLDPTGGWSGRVHGRLLDLVDELTAMEEEDAVTRLREIDGIGEGKAEAIATAIDEQREAVARGNVDVHPAFVTLAQHITEQTVGEQRAPIDEPVTTDTNRLIRLPGSLHGGSGLAVQRINRNELDEFEPLRDAVPETFRGQTIRIDVTDLDGLAPAENPEIAELEIGGDSFTIAGGSQSVPEHVGIFLLARGHADKEKETG